MSLSLLLPLLLLLPASPPGAKASEGEEALLASRVRALLSDRCFSCHGPDGAARRAGLRLDRIDGWAADRKGRPVVEPGHPDHSVLIARIEETDPDRRMPPPPSGLSLTEEDRSLLRRWVEAGAPWTEHWSFVPPRRPAVPPAAAHPVDAFLQRALDERGLEASPPAAPELQLRRLSFDLTGLSPTLDELDAFLADHGPGAWDRAVDRLLESPHYGETMALPWLDAARYADTNGYQGDGTRTMWPWRDWVIRAFQDNLPFDRFTVLQLAGDLLPDAGRDERVATGFHRNHMLNGEGGRIAEESRVESVIDRVNTTATVWMGLTLACAQCHDHKYDPFSQREYYRLYAFFDNVDETGAVDAGGNARPVLRVPTEEQEGELASLEQRETELRAALRTTDPDTPAEPAAAALQAWEAEVAERRAAGAAEWTELVPDAVHTARPIDVRRTPDGSVLLLGENPEQNDYRVEVQLPAGRWTAVRLDVLTHPRFTNGYLARSNSGNFVLTGLRLEGVDPAGAPTAIPLARAQADFQQGGHEAQQAIDGRDDTGWAVHGDPGFGPHRAIFHFQTPIELERPRRVLVHLEHRSVHLHHTIGRFRLSVGSAAEPDLEDGLVLSPAAREALALAPSDRDGIQQDAVRAAYLAHRRPDPRLAAELRALLERRGAIEGSVVSTMVMQERAERRTTYRLVRGQYDAPDRSEELMPGVPAALGPLPATEGPATRLDLARWLVSPEHPLTARVTVNRFWQQFFGRGLVRTSEDLGVQGERPTHPELLDWLAVEFVERGWDVKALVRLLVTSEAYRRSSRLSPGRRELDPDNRWRARGPRGRRSSFALRDQALALGGLLVEKVGGPPVLPYQPEGVWAEATFGTIRYQQGSGEDLYRRSLYTFWRRIVGPTTLFDTSARQTCIVRREATNTPLHALTTLNDVTFVEAARAFATRSLATPGDRRARIARAFRRATSRVARPAELDHLEAALADFEAAFQAQPGAAAALLEVGNSPLSGAHDPRLLAAWTLLCQILLNLDETLSTS